VKKSWLSNKFSDFFAVVSCLWWHQILVSWCWVLLACRAEDPIDFSSLNWCEAGRKILFRTGKLSRKAPTHRELFLPIQDTFPFEKPKSAPGYHWKIPFGFHSCFSYRWDLRLCHCHHQYLPNSSWKGAGSSSHRFAALHMKSNHQMKYIVIADLQQFLKVWMQGSIFGECLFKRRKVYQVSFLYTANPQQEFFFKCRQLLACIQNANSPSL